MSAQQFQKLVAIGAPSTTLAAVRSQFERSPYACPRAETLSSVECIRNADDSYTIYLYPWCCTPPTHAYGASSFVANKFRRKRRARKSATPIQLTPKLQTERSVSKTVIYRTKILFEILNFIEQS